MKTEFNLSDRIFNDQIDVKYIKKFIKNLKDIKFWKSHNEAIEFGKMIDNLSGEELIK